MSVVGGLDLNGAWDWAALSGGSGSDGTPLEPRLNSGGINGSIIQLYDDNQLVGGPQAELAPHGRGPGWGKIGDAAYRTQVRHVLAQIVADTVSEDTSVSKLHAVVDALAGDADSLVCAVPDHPGFGEANRQALLDALRARQRGSVNLIWRPIATLLGWLAGSEATGHDGLFQEDMPVCVVSLMPDGVRVAGARLKAYAGRNRSIWVPERREPGVLLDGQYAGAELARRHADTLAQQVEQDPAQVFDVMTAPWRAAMAQPGGETVVRLANRSWRRLESIDAQSDFAELPAPNRHALDRIQAAQHVVVDGPFSANEAWRQHVLAALGVNESDRRIHFAGPTTAALGCREAGERMAAGEPPYYDFLPQLEINALKDDEEQFVDLIGKDQRAVGGKPFVGEPDAKFAINAGARELTFYLIKEDFDRPRKAVHTLPESPTEDHPINVTVQQTPGQGYARVEISSSSYRPLRDTPLVLDWDQMEVLETDRETLLQELRDYSGIGYPDTYMECGHALHWHPGAWKEDLVDLLDRYGQTADANTTGLDNQASSTLGKIATRFQRFETPNNAAKRIGATGNDKHSYRCMNSNGTLPKDDPPFYVDPNAETVLDKALLRAESHFLQLTQNPKVNNKNDVRNIVLFATWSHSRCPDLIRTTLQKWNEAEDPFALPDRLIVIGTGRIVYDQEDIKKFFQHCARRLQRDGELKDRHFAGLGQILGRRREAAGILDRQEAYLFVQEAHRLLHQENHKREEDAYKNLFKYGLLMLAVILRFRQKKTDFLRLPDSRSARELQDALETSIARMVRFIENRDKKASRSRRADKIQEHRAAKARLVRHKNTAENLLSFLKMEGGDPNIIRVIEESD